MTAPRPRIRRLPGLPMGACRWLLGKDPQPTEEGGVRHGSIVRWRHLLVRKSGQEDWDAFLAAFWDEHRDWIVSRHIARHPGSRPLRWWQYDAPAPRRRGESERAYLRRHRLLLRDERVRPAKVRPERVRRELVEP
jgi:hypothetical protein